MHVADFNYTAGKLLARTHSQQVANSTGKELGGRLRLIACATFFIQIRSTINDHYHSFSALSQIPYKVRTLLDTNDIKLYHWYSDKLENA